MFPVRKYGETLDAMAAARGIETLFGTELAAVDGPARRATFRDIQTGRPPPPPTRPHPEQHGGRFPAAGTAGALSSR